MIPKRYGICIGFYPSAMSTTIIVVIIGIIGILSLISQGEILMVESRAVCTMKYSNRDHFYNRCRVPSSSVTVPTIKNTMALLTRMRGGASSSTGQSNHFSFDSIGTQQQHQIPLSLSSSKNIVYETLLLTMNIITFTFNTILPPLIQITNGIIQFYHILPLDLIIAQIGLLYAFVGGYYPTLFATIQAVHYSGGTNTVLHSIRVLYNQASTAIKACNIPSSIRDSVKPASFTFNEKNEYRRAAHDIILEKIKIVMATIDPVPINDAIAAIYTTWLTVSIVLEREFARTIALSISIADSIRPIVSFVMIKPLQYCIEEQYYKWIPIIIGWICKACAMSIAWRIQRVLTAYTSSIAGGLLCSRALCRIISKQWKKRSSGLRSIFGLLLPINPNNKRSRKTSTSTANNEYTDYSTASPNYNNVTTQQYHHLDVLLGYMIAMCGLYAQVGRGDLSFTVPFPYSLITWPLDMAENWIQWQITKGKE